jgi:hypothetical protein
VVLGNTRRTVRWAQIYANTSTNFGPQAKPRQWVENILGRELEAGEQIGIDDLVGGKHHLMVENVKRDGRTFDNVSAVQKYQEEEDNLRGRR